ncbi:glycerophosphodiester phosphodiesterase [Planococcus koreensis]|uniref:glycerophosphodiester phosphodiesterase n=1 Tax=Planococcus koreensis TaxID=112331 RepID=UPI0039FDC1EB
MSELRIYAHRGASGYSLENTWNAFRKAGESGVGIELDLQITKDGVVIVFHDDNLKRLSGKNLKIDEAEYSLMKELKIGKRWHRRFWHDSIPLGYEVIQWAKEKKVPLNIELKSSFMKHSDGPRIIASMLEGAEDFHVSSFHPELLRDMKALLPEAEMALILKKRIPLEMLDGMHWVDSIHLHKRIYSKRFLEALHGMEKTVRVYGFRGREAAMKKLAPELKGIITDYPHRVTKKLRPPSKG